MKQSYEHPALEIIVLEAADVVTVSGGPGDNEGPGMPDD